VLKFLLRRLAIATIKPLVGDATWRRLRRRFGFLVASDRLERMSLNQLARKFHSDKWGKHWYTQHYERHLAHLKHDAFTLLEIGIGGYRSPRKGGASLRMWHAYFPRARIIGLDVEDKSFLDGERMRTVRGSQTDADLLRRIVDEAGGIRVVIDDGSHRPQQVRASFETLFPLLEDGGIYAIEDTQTSYWPEFGGSDDLADPMTTMAMVKGLLDGLNYEEYVDDSYQPSYTDLHVVAVHAYHNLVIIEKGRNVEGTNRRRILRKRYATAPAETNVEASARANSWTTRRRPDSACAPAS
jgi:hypothetical protein